MVGGGEAPVYEYRGELLHCCDLVLKSEFLSLEQWQVGGIV